MGAIEDEKVYGLKIRESANDGSDFGTPDADYRFFFVGEDGRLHLKDAADVVTDPAGSTSYSVPTVVSVGTSATGTGNVTPGLPAGHTTNDILLLFVQSNMQAATAPAGYAQLGPSAGIGIAAAAGAFLGTVFWKRDGGAEAAPTVTDTGDHTLAQMMAIRGCPTSGDPFLNIGATRKSTASTTGTASAGATPVDACMVINAFFHGLDSASAIFSSFTNADLSSVTEQIDVATADGNGGGIGVCTGTKSLSGSFAATTVTETSTTDTSVTFVMLPAGISSRAGFIDRQVFLAPGIADTWFKPTGARTVQMTLIGGGASGSAGRNAATAAGGGGGGGAAQQELNFPASVLPSSCTVTAGAGGAATANTDGAASTAGGGTLVAAGAVTYFAGGGGAATASATGSGGTGGTGGGRGDTPAAGADASGLQRTGGGTGGTTAQAGGDSAGESGGAGAGGGTSQAASQGGYSQRGGGGGGGGRSNTNVGTGGGAGYGSVGSGGQFPGGQTAGANGTDGNLIFGGGGGAGGTSAAGPGGQGGWPGGGGGGGGSQSGAQRGGAGGDGVATITTYCG